MSRGGRGGGRGGRLKGGHPEWEQGVKLDSKPSETFPYYIPPVTAPATEKEKREIGYYLKLREEIHDGPLYTKSSTHNKWMKTYGEDQYNSQYDSRSKADIDPFHGVPTYSKKYEPKTRALPVLTGYFNKELFPKELWATLDGEDGQAVKSGVNKAIKKKATLFSRADPAVQLTEAERKQSLFNKIKDVTEDADGDEEAEQDEDEVPEEDEDHDYEEDEEEMGGDYDAEQYFDGGEDEDGDDGDGGGDEY